MLRATNFFRSSSRTALVTATLACVLAFSANAHPMYDLVGVAYSSKGDLIAGFDEGYNVYIWSTASGKMLDHFNPAKAGGLGPMALGFSHDGRMLFVGTQTDLESFDLNTGVRATVAPLHAAMAVVFGSNDLVAVASESSISVLDARTGGNRFDFRTDAFELPFTIAFSPDGKYLAAGNQATEAGLALPHLMMGNANKVLRIFDVRTGHVVQQLTGLGTWFGSVAFSKDSKLVAAISYEHRPDAPINEQTDPTLTVWDRVSQNTIIEFPLLYHGLNYNTMVFMPDSQHIIGTATSTFEGNVFTARLQNGCVINQTDGIKPIWSASLSPQGGTFAIGGMIGEIQTFSIPETLPSDVAGCKPVTPNQLRLVQHFDD